MMEMVIFYLITQEIQIMVKLMELTWDEEGYETPKVAVTFSVNMNDYIEETGDSLENHGGLYI